MPKYAMIPDSAGDEYPVYKANHNAFVQRKSANTMLNC